jgi:hypothetical protein
MATVTVTITDRPEGITVVAESDPPIPMNGDDPDVDACTDAQAAGIFAAMTLHNSMGKSEWRTLVRLGPQ